MGLEIQNIVDIVKTNNFELVMRLATNIDSNDIFFTDANGYQVRFDSFRLRILTFFADSETSALQKTTTTSQLLSHANRSVY